MVDDEVTRHLVGHQADVTAAEVDEVERTPQIHLPEYPREWVTGGPCAIVRHKVVDHLCDVGDGWVLDSTPLCVARLLDGLVVEAEVARTRRGCVGGRAALLLAVLGGPPEWGQVGPRDGQSGGLGQDEGQAGAMELLHLHSVDCTGGRLIQLPEFGEAVVGPLGVRLKARREVDSHAHLHQGAEVGEVWVVRADRRGDPGVVHAAGQQLGVPSANHAVEIPHVRPKERLVAVDQVLRHRVPRRPLDRVLGVVEEVGAFVGRDRQLS